MQVCGLHSAPHTGAGAVTAVLHFWTCPGLQDYYRQVCVYVCVCVSVSWHLSVCCVGLGACFLSRP